MIDLNPHHLETVNAILAEHVPECEVWAFGSRATWTAKDYSDLDLAVVGKGPLDWNMLGHLKEAFEESNLPMRVDVLDWHSISESFRKVIERDCVVIQRRGMQIKTDRWRKAALNDVIELTLSSVDKKSKPNEHAVRLCNYTDVYNNNFIHAGLDFMVATATEREISRCSLVTGDVVITKDSEKYDDIGVPAVVREDIHDLVCGYHLAILRPLQSKVDGTYLFYALNSWEVQRQFHAYANGVTRFGLRKADIGRVEIPLPPLSEQRRIAHVLGTLDDKIELNRRMNATLEGMARALFKSWFVDFEPVRAKMKGRWRRGESLPGMPAELYDLFPERLAPSELGDVPEGWDVETISDCFNLTMGQSPPGSTYNDDVEGMSFFQGNADFGFRYPRNRRYCTAPKRLAKPDDTLVSVRAPVGSINMAWEQCCIGRGLAALRHKSGSASYTYYALMLLQEELQQYEHTGTVFGAINKRQFANLKIMEPSAEIVGLFGSLASVWDGRIRLNTAESNALAAQRDVFLPGLVSGEVGVEEESSTAFVS